MKLSIVHVILTLLVLGLTGCSDQAGTLSETEMGSLTAGIYGTIVSEKGKPVEDVVVIATTINNTDIPQNRDTVYTNSKGIYHFSNLSSGTYLLEGHYYFDTTLTNTAIDTLTFDSTSYIDSALNLGIDTLLSPGFIVGSVETYEVNMRGVHMYIPGTSYGAFSDSSGNFEIANIPADSGYRLIYSYDGYSDGTDTNLVITPGDTVYLPKKKLEFDAEKTPPAPINLRATYTQENRTVAISWTSVPHPALGGYLLYRKDSSQTAENPMKISGSTLIEDTVFMDSSLIVLPGERKTVQYQVQSQHNINGNRSDYSYPVFLTISGHEIVQGAMKRIPAAGQTFTMGLQSQLETTDTLSMPAHQVTFTYNFWMDSCEVSQKLYKEVMTGSTGYDNHKIPTWSATYGLGDLYPAYWISWYDAILYCNALSKIDGYDTVYTYKERSYPNPNGPESGVVLSELSVNFDKNGYRLPTEAEWEYAARSQSTADFFWGRNCSPYPQTAEDSLEFFSFAHWNTPSQSSSAICGIKKANTFGLYDVTGNLFELCNDYFDADLYDLGDCTNPVGPESGGRVVMRGGSYVGNKAEYLRTGRRTPFPKEYSGRDIGFRVVRK